MGGSMTKVLPGLFVGGGENAKNEEELIANCISHILVIQAFKGELDKSPSRTYLQVVISEEDTRGLFRRLSEANDFIHSARVEAGNVLVCSDSGLSTCVAVTAAYLMSVYGLDSRSAVAAVQGLRHGAHPVAALQEQLDLLSSPDLKSVDSSQCQDSQKSLHNGNGRVPSSPSSLTTAASEHQRLISKFGKWPHFEEDMHLLRTAIDSQKSLTDLGFGLCGEPGYLNISSTFDKTPDSPSPFVPPADIHSSLEIKPHRKKVQWSPPATPPSTPINPVLVNADRSVTVNAQDLTPTPSGLVEDQLFSMDAGVMDPNIEGDTPTECNRQVPINQSHSRFDNVEDDSYHRSGLEPDEIGLELRGDEEIGDEDDDDVPGAVAMPSFRSRGELGMAATYNVRTSEMFAQRSYPIPIAHSFAPRHYLAPSEMNTGAAPNFPTPANMVPGTFSSSRFGNATSRLSTTAPDHRIYLPF
ncbi:unnamed protein product [Calicophoron daubneyi]|uniref:Tyrosine-protein phosphatase domain-containing protein n=1 Tax=Calicophoron daubneyi TaxID=300641 RepID=A0AAV2TIH6_CALDB